MAPDPHLVIAAVLAASLSGCATTSDPVGGATSNQLAINPFDQPGARPGVFLAGRLEGTLTSDGRCVIVVQAAQSVTPLWPGGTTVLDAGGRATVSLPDGRGSAALGKRVTLSGGAFPAADAGRLADAVRRNCPGSFFVVAIVD